MTAHAVSSLCEDNSARRRLLVVDDEADCLDLVRRAFREEFEIHTARDGDEGLRKARELRPEVIITDQRMPTMTGVEFLTQIREELPKTVRVLVTGYSDYGSLVDAVNAARVHHYLEKPFHTVDLKTVVDALTRTMALETERQALLSRLQESISALEHANTELKGKESELELRVVERTHALERANQDLADVNRQLKDMAVRDGLTALFNHRYLLEHLNIEIARSRRYKRACSVLFLDLDNFKQVNDRYGHATGDAVLRRVANLLRPEHEGLRTSDFSARYGGEEFCVVLPETPAEGGKIKAERIRQAVERSNWSAVDSRIDKPVTVSIGVASYPRHGGGVEELIDAADRAQYEAKRRGRNSVVVADELMPDLASRSPGPKKD